MSSIKRNRNSRSSRRLRVLLNAHKFYCDSKSESGNVLGCSRSTKVFLGHEGPLENANLGTEPYLYRTKDRRRQNGERTQISVTRNTECGPSGSYRQVIESPLYLHRNDNHDGCFQHVKFFFCSFFISVKEREGDMWWTGEDDLHTGLSLSAPSY